MTINSSLLILAMAGAPAGGEQQAPGLGAMFLPMIIIFAIFYFMLIRPQQRKEKERKQMVDNIKSGERILFSGGIIGTVTNVKDGVFVVKIADNVKIEIARGAVIKVLEKDEKPQAESEK